MTERAEPSSTNTIRYATAVTSRHACGTRARRSAAIRSTIGVVAASTNTASVAASPRTATTAAGVADAATPTVGRPSQPTVTSNDAAPSVRNAAGAANPRVSVRAGTPAGPSNTAAATTTVSTPPGHHGNANAQASSPTTRTPLSRTRRTRQGLSHAASSRARPLTGAA